MNNRDLLQDATATLNRIEQLCAHAEPDGLIATTAIYAILEGEQ